MRPKGVGDLTAHHTLGFGVTGPQSWWQTLPRCEITFLGHRFRLRWIFIEKVLDSFFEFAQFLASGVVQFFEVFKVVPELADFLLKKFSVLMWESHRVFSKEGDLPSLDCLSGKDFRCHFGRE